MDLLRQVNQFVDGYFLVAQSAYHLDEYIAFAVAEFFRFRYLLSTFHLRAFPPYR